MDTIFRKLDYKDETHLAVLNAPEEFELPLTDMKEIRQVDEVLGDATYSFVLAFVRQKEDIAVLADQLEGKLAEDAKLWVAYPKKSSKKYDSDISRDEGWQPLGDMGYEGVRQIAIDEDWSGLRLRHVDFIKNMDRDSSRAMSSKGKERTKK